jgi:hypothetical protein
MKEWKNRTTLPIDNYTGTIFKIQMNLFRDGKPNEMRTVNMGSHLMTNEDTEEVTICTFDDRTVTYGMGHTYSSPATLQEIADWVAEMQDRQAILDADYDREMQEEEFLQRSGNIY